MSRKVKFPLKMANEAQVRILKELECVLLQKPHYKIKKVSINANR